MIKKESTPEERQKLIYNSCESLLIKNGFFHRYCERTQENYDYIK